MTEFRPPPVNIYLSGHMHHEEHDWWEEVLVALKDDHIRWLVPKHGPFSDETRHSANYYVPRDMLAVQQADIVLAFVEDLARNVGTAWECGYAYARGRPVIALQTDFRGGEDDSLNLMLRRSSTRVIQNSGTNEEIEPLASALATALAELGDS